MSGNWQVLGRRNERSRVMSTGHLLMNREMGFFTIKVVVTKTEMEAYELGLYEKFHKIAMQHDCVACDSLAWPAEIMRTIEESIPDIEAEENAGGKLYLVKRCVQHDEGRQEIHLHY